MPGKKSKKAAKKMTPRAKQKAILKKEIGSRIREIRKNLHYTQSEIVSSFPCGRANYSRIEKGEVFPNAIILKALREQYRVSLHWLVCNEGQMIEQEEEKDILAIKTPADGKEAEEIKKLFFYIDSVPLVKHAVMGFFLEFIAKNKEFIEPDLEKASGKRAVNGQR